MRTFVLSDRGHATPDDLRKAPLAGAESAFVELAQALARRGHRVLVRYGGSRTFQEGTLDWAPFGRPVPVGADLHVANRDSRLLTSVPRPRHRVLWLHNTARYLLRPRHQLRLLRHRPTLVFSGRYHRSTYPWWLPPYDRVEIPYGIPEPFRHAAPPAKAPGPRAVFTSNPLRSLDWLLDVWQRRIRPRVPQAELHLFSGPSTYGAWGAQVRDRMEAILRRARNASDQGVVVREPVDKETLIDELRASRVMLYRGDLAETFCLAVAEAQALGVPCVVQPLGSLPERVRDGETGFVAADEESFGDRAVALLTQDDLWQRTHDAALRMQRSRSWDDAAAEFEKLAELGS